MDDINNISINREKGSALISLNSEIYALEVIFSAAYVLMNRAYIVLDGNPSEEVIVQIKSKNKDVDIETLVYDFNNELLNYAMYKIQSEKNKEIKNAILQRVLLTNINIETDKISLADFSQDDYTKDTEEILKPFKG